MLYLQTDFPSDTGIPRWGCFLLSIVYGAMDATGLEVTYREVLDLFTAALRIRLPWDTSKTIVSKDADNTLWCHDPDGWLRMVLEAIEPGRWRGWQTGENGRWFQGANWYNGPGPADWSFVLLNWERPTGGHYTCLTPRGHMDPMDGKLRLIPRGQFRTFSVREVT